MSERIGDAMIRGHYDPDGQLADVELLKADDLIAVARELLADHDERWMRVDGDHLTLCGEAFYVATGGRTDRGDVIYRRLRNEGDA